MKLCNRQFLILALLSVCLCTGGVFAQELSSPKYTKPNKDLHISYDFNLGNKTVDLNGPAFGVSWLMQNKFINTFDFAVSNNSTLNEADNTSVRSISFRYQIMYMPDLGFKKFKPVFGLGMDKELTGERDWGIFAVGGIRYPVYHNYFVEVLVPYSVYQNNFQMFQRATSSFSDGTMITTRGRDMKTKKQSAVRIGLGVSF